MDWWGLPNRPVWALAPDRGAAVSKRVLGCTHGLRASVFILGAGIKVNLPALQEWADSRMRSLVGRITCDDDLGTVLPPRLSVTLWVLIRSAHKRKGGKACKSAHELALFL